MTTKTLYEEALTDVKSLKEVAENNAKHAVINAVLPRIREMIEASLLEADDQDDEILDDADESAAAAISPPDAEGKVTLDIDAMTDEGALNTDEGEQALDQVAATQENTVYSDEAVKELCESTTVLAGAGRLLRATSGYSDQIMRTISRVQDMYGCLQEAIDIAPDKKKEHEEVLEGCHRKLQELKMVKKNKKAVNEADVTLKLSGLPDDVDLDSVGVDLISDEEGDEAAGAPADADGDQDGDELDLSDLGGDEGGDEGDLDMGESLSHLSDDTVVEIDESMLRREIARMKSLREEAEVGAGAHTMGAAEFDDFGGGKKDHEPFLDGEVESGGFEPLGETDEMDEGDEGLDEDDDAMDEMDELDQLSNRRKSDEFDAGVVDGHDSPMADRRHESLKRRFGFEKRLQERLRNRIRATRKAALKAEGKRATLLVRSHRALMARLGESVKRTDKIKRLVVEAKSSTTAKNGVRSKSSKVVNALRAKLDEANLFNAKLSYTNKILQNGRLTANQKARAIEQFEGAKNLAEAKLVYESLTKLLARKPVTESTDRRVIGSASRATRSAGAQPTVNEGFEIERWGKLAGIK